jgi:hypothetical protein
LPLTRRWVGSEDYQAGPAIGYCLEYEEGKLFAGNGEYESQVNFCPICGCPAKVKISKINRK